MAEAFRLVTFPDAEEAPDFRFPLPFDQPARLQVAIEPGLISGKNWTQTHRDGRELPELRHQIRMRIGRKPAAFRQLLAKIVQMPLIQPSLQKRARLIAGRGVTLKV